MTRFSLGLAFAALAAVGCKKDAATTTPTGDAAAAASSSIDAAPPSPARGVPIPAASIAAVVNPENLPPYNGPTGSLEGRITVVGDPAPDNDVSFAKCPQAEKVYAKAFREGAPLPDGSRPLADALVVVTGYSGFYIPEKEEAKTIAIENCAYTQRTLDLTFGQRIEIVNKTQGQLFGPELSNHPMAALMVAPFGADAVKIWPKSPGFAQVIDKLGHDYLVLDVYTMLQPLHTVSKLDGTYRLDGLPVGKLEVHSRLRAINDDVSKPVEIRQNVVAHVDLQMRYTNPARDAGSGPAPAADAGASKVRAK